MMPLATFKRPLGGQVGVELVPHQAGDRVEVFVDRFGVRTSIGFALEEVGELVAALEEALGLASGADRSRARVTPRLRSRCTLRGRA